jgi:bilirubin oxidase
MKKIVLLFVGISSFYECLAQNALYIPSAIYGKNFNLEIQNGNTSFFPNTVSSTIGINQNYLAPTLVLEQGDTVQMNVKNSLNDTTTLHWHGLHVPPTEDGGPHTYILSGNTWQPKFVVKDWAATYWYHPHLHHKTNEHVTKGAAGLIIVRDAVEQALALPRSYSIDDIPLILQTKAFNASKQI